MTLSLLALAASLLTSPARAGEGELELVIVPVSEASSSSPEAEACAAALEIPLTSTASSVPPEGRTDPFASAMSIVEHRGSLWLVIDDLACELTDDEAAPFEAAMADTDGELPVAPLRGWWDVDEERWDTEGVAVIATR